MLTEEIMSRPDHYDKLSAQTLMKAPPTIVEVHESMPDIMRKFDQTRAWNLPVLRAEQYVGFISKSYIFSAYRNYLAMLSGG